MKKVGASGIWRLIFTISMILICHNAGWSEEWIQINLTAFKGSNEAARTFQEAVFDTNHLYVVTSDSDFRFDDLHIKDQSRTTILWRSKVYKDPNIWNNKVYEDPNIWDKVWADGNGTRVDRLFNGLGYVYAGVYNNGNCRVYRFSDPPAKTEVVIDKNLDDKAKWRVDNGEEFGEEFKEKLYIGIYEEDYGGRVFRSNTPEGPIEDKEVDVGLIQIEASNIKISLLSHVGERLFLGTKKREQGAELSYTPNGNYWILSGPGTFNDSNDSENIVAFLSMVKFMGKGWLLTELMENGKKQWALWKTLINSDAPQWKKQISSQDPNGPFSDPNILAVSELRPIGEYLYLACLCNDGGKIWKSYRGEDEEWICVPSPSDPNNSFNQDNLLRGIFFNPNDIDHIYAGTKNNKGAQILTRLVPMMDILDLSMEDRFVGPKKHKISMEIRPNWKDPNYWEDPAHLPQALVLSRKDPNAIQNYFVEPNQADPSLWEFDPNRFTKEGIYHLIWELSYGKDEERVLRYLSFAWDANSPSAPENLQIGEGDGHLEVQWTPSSDSIGDIADLEDTNFRQSILGYKLEWWPEDDSNQVSNIDDIPGGYSGQKVDIPNLQNYTTYKIRVRAIDKANNTSNWSEVAEGIPQETFGWLKLLGERGGCFISSVYSKKREDPGGGGRWLAGLKVGRYKPDSEEADLVYGEDRAWPVQIEVGWIHRPYLEVSFGTGYMEMDGFALKSLTQEKSIDSVTFRMVPCSMTFRWIPFRDSGHVLIPYIGGGINAWWYQEEELKGEDTSGWNYGYHGLCGVRMLLDRFDLKHAKFLSEDYGVIDTYLTLEVVYNWIDNLGDSRLDLGGAFYQVGILFLF